MNDSFSKHDRSPAAQRMESQGHHASTAAPEAHWNNKLMSRVSSVMTDTLLTWSIRLEGLTFRCGRIIIAFGIKACSKSYTHVKVLYFADQARNSGYMSIFNHQSHLLESFLKYVLFTAVACSMSKTDSPMPRKRSEMDRMVGSDMSVTFGLVNKCKFKASTKKTGGTEKDWNGN